ncbi:hypothetical protein GCM10009678_56700 [Actinomadura kijaniata]|uniref:Uncharacterized protein n=1 Tax=Actinomadura namibiensis TaxID=182080 RepID=A0A7W3LL26_ACTNM|nr:hypothetical protein [Actinomadura namibiensis]MBA8950107.1 hypothetical protein [Actinomadura namibiensis]
MKKPTRKQAATAGAVPLALVLSACSAPATPRSAPTTPSAPTATAVASHCWHVTHEFEENKEWYRDIAAISDENVWVVGTRRFGKNARDSAPLVRRWDGRRWSRVELPEPAGSGPIKLNRVSASSPTNVWIVGDDDDEARDFKDIRQYWWHWDGRRWEIYRARTYRSTEPFPSNSAIPLAVGAKSAWWFNVPDEGPNPYGGDVRFFDGRRWREVSTPGFLHSISALSDRDAWAVGAGWSSNQPVPAYLVRWNGKTWNDHPLPKSLTGLGNPQSGRSYPASGWEILARTDRDVWLLGNGLHHWDGRRWNPVPTPGKGDLKSLTDDGAGGLWFKSGKGLVHYRAGKWIKPQRLDPLGKTSEISAMTRVPGTSSMWALGVRFAWGASKHMILRCND